MVAAALFAVHPIVSEPVNYVFARGTLLCSVLCLAALGSWTRGRPWYACAWFVAALLAKEECVAFPVVLLLLYWSISRPRTERIPIAVMLLLSLIVGVSAAVVASRTPGSEAGLQAAWSSQFYAAAQGPVIWRYLRQIVLPWGFSIDPDIQPPSWPIAAVAWTALAAASLLAIRRFSGAREGFWFLAGIALLLPSSSIFPASDLAADRRMYLPLIAFGPALALRMERWRPPAVAALVIALAALSAARTLTWASERALWTEAIERAPHKIRPRLQLARAVPVPEAIQVLADAEKIAPEDPAIASEQGRMYLEVGDPARALSAFGRALALKPGDAQALNNRGAALLALGQQQAAKADFERALHADPCLGQARENLRRVGATDVPLPCR